MDIFVKYEKISWRLFLVLIRALFWFKACRTHFGWRTLLVHLKIYRNEEINHLAVFTPKEMYLLGSHISISECTFMYRLSEERAICEL